MKSRFLLFAALAILSAPVFAQTGDTVTVSLPFAAVTPLIDNLPETSHPAIRVTLADGKTMVLPMAADTSLWKNSPADNSRTGFLALRDARFSQALLKPDLSVLPAGTVVKQAQLIFVPGWLQKPGGMTFKIHRMLTPWAPDASYLKSSADAAQNWDGMKPGTDFEAAPAATGTVPQVLAGKKITIDGLETLVNGWLAGTYPNNGFTIQATGSAIQVNIDSTEAAERAQPPYVLGGPADSKLLLRPNLAAVNAVPLQPDDLKDAALRLSFSMAPAPDKRAGISVAVFRPLKAQLASPPVAGVDYDPKPVAVAPLTSLDPDKVIRIPGVLPALKSGGLLVACQSDGAARPQLPVTGPRNAKNQPFLDLSIVNRPKAVLFDYPIKPRPGVFNQMKDGHFNYGGQRLRLWGTLGHAIDADRLRKMGFNAWRMWDSAIKYTPESAKNGEPAPEDPAAGPNTYDKFFASLKQSGMFVMLAGLTGTMPVKDVAVDGSFVAPAENASAEDKADWASWRDAVKAELPRRLEGMFIYFDPRLQTIRKRHAKNMLLHVNPVTGKNYAEDEAIALYENFNESAFFRKVMDGDGDKWQPYFKTEFQNRWNAWLRAKYKDDAGLKAAWGKLDEGESLAANSVKAAPVVAQAANYPAARGSDFIRFVGGLVIDFNLDFEKYCRSLAPQGVGINVIPFSFDSQYIPSVQWAYQRSAGQVNCFGMYSWDTKSVLGRPPGNYVMDSHDIEGRATVIYETNQSRPDPYRTEYPYRTAALACWQDWDGVFWHYWGAADYPSDEDYLTRPMLQLTASHYWTGVHHENDPAMTEAMAMAGRIFLGGAMAPAPNPAVVEIGARDLFQFNPHNALSLSQITYSQGSRLRFKPESDSDVLVNGKPMPDSERLSEAVRSGDGVVWDWPNSRLIIDTPTAKAYIGKTAASYTFKDGTTLSGFNTPFISWALISADGKPLTGPNGTQRAYLSGVFDARNTGFETDYNFSGGPVEQANVIRDRGTAPILVDKVSFTLAFPNQVTGEVSGYDFALRQASDTKINGSNVVRVKDSTNWVNLLTVSGRGALAKPVIDPSPGAPPAAVIATAGPDQNAPRRWTAVFNPIPGLSWGDGYAAAHAILRNSKVRFTAITPEDTTANPKKTISWSGAEALFDAPADIDLSFQNDRLAKISATLKRPIDFPAAIAAYEKQFGPAAEKVLGKAQFETNLGRWQVKSADGTLSLVLTQSQGEIKASYEFTPA